MILARMRSLVGEQNDYLDSSTRYRAKQTFDSVARTLLRQIASLDEQSMISTLAVLGKGSPSANFEILRPSSEQLNEIEQRVLRDFEIYLSHDISSVVANLIKLGHPPVYLLDMINKMNQVSTFNKDQCVVMLEALTEAPENEKTSRLKKELFTKFFD